MQVFISYVREDWEIAKRLYNDLKLAGVSPWLDTENLLPGQKWKLEITKAIRESSYIIVLLSSHSLSKRGYVARELKSALDLLEQFPPSQIFLIPVRIDDCEPVDERLQELHWVDLFPSYDDGLRLILRVLLPERPTDQESYIQGEDYGIKNIAIVSSKGGTGKSIIVASIGYILAYCGFRTLLVDMDLFTHGLTFYLLAENVRKPNISLTDIFTEEKNDKEISPIEIQHKFTNNNLYILPSIAKHRHTEAELHLNQKFNDLAAFQNKIHGTIEEEKFDYVIFDTRGGTDYTSIGTTQAAGAFIMVTEADKPSWDMGRVFFDTIEEIDFKQETKRAGFIINKNVLPSEAIEAFLRKEWESPHLTTIPLDENAIRFFQEDAVPVASDIGCPFSKELLPIIRKVFVSKRWSVDNVSKLKVLEDSSITISRTRQNREENIRKAEKYSFIMRIYGTLLATVLLAFLGFSQISGDSTPNYSIAIVTAILIFLMTVSDPKIVRSFIEPILKLIRPKKE